MLNEYAYIQGCNDAPQNLPAVSPAHFKPRGSNQIGLRQYNERVVLQAIRLHGAQPKADLARLTHLSTQTVSLIIDRLIEDGLVMRLAPVRGKVGQPSVPITLNSDGAFSIGIKIGRRNCDALLLDFSGQVRERSSLSYDFPDPKKLFAYVQSQMRALPAKLGAQRAERLVGVGVAAPLSLGGWQALLGVSKQRSEAWSGIDIQTQLQAMTALPVRLIKDTSAACVAELVAGRGRSTKSYVYMFIDTFIGGGMVIDSKLRAGLHGNAGAIGSMALGTIGHASHDVATRAGAVAQVLSVASLYQLELLFSQAGLDATACYDDRALEGAYLPHTQRWLKQATAAIAMVVQHTVCLLDMDAVIIDGSLSRSLLAMLRLELDVALQAYSWEGIEQPDVQLGMIGADARAMGGALLPLYSNFAPDHEVFLK